MSWLSWGVCNLPFFIDFIDLECYLFVLILLILGGLGGLWWGSFFLFWISFSFFLLGWEDSLWCCKEPDNCWSHHPIEGLLFFPLFFFLLSIFLFFLFNFLFFLFSFFFDWFVLLNKYFIWVVGRKNMISYFVFLVIGTNYKTSSSKKRKLNFVKVWK